MAVKQSRIFVAGHQGLVGSAIVRALSANGANHIVTKCRAELDLTELSQVRNFFQSEQIDQVYFAAAMVGGIYANSTYPAEFIYSNLMVQTMVVHEAWRGGVQKLLFLGTFSVYPRLCEQPIREDYLMNRPLEPTNEAYAMAKIAGIKLCESYNRQYGTDFRSVMPTIVYGPNDSFHPSNSHVVPALIRRIHKAKADNAQIVSIWRSGKPMREFLYVDDMANASVYLMNLDQKRYCENIDPMHSHINVGAGVGIAIEDLASLVANIIGFQGKSSLIRVSPTALHENY